MGNRTLHGVLVGKAERKRHLQYICANERIILKYTLKKQDGTAWTGFIWLRTGTSDRFL
jgi:hypothetical protein